MFGDLAHVPRNVVPGDGAHVLWTALLGPNRGRYLIFAEEEVINAQQALTILESLERSWTARRIDVACLGTRFANRIQAIGRGAPTRKLRGYRPLKTAFDDNLAFGLALEGAVLRQSAPSRRSSPSNSDATNGNLRTLCLRRLRHRNGAF